MRYAVAVVLVMVGLVFLGQGIGLLPGSFMSGQQTWAVIGAAMVAAGVWLAWRARRSSSR